MSEDMSTLVEILQEHFDLNLSRIKCLSQLLLCMLSLRTVSLWQLCQIMQGSASTNSHYRRLQRFMSEVRLPRNAVALCILYITGLLERKQWQLCMDRTNWKIGVFDVNILYLAICHKNVAIPIFWSFIENKKHGGTDHIDRIDIMESFLQLFDAGRIEVLLADREFIGGPWLDWLEEHNIFYVIRLKESGHRMTNSRGVFLIVQELLRPLAPGGTVYLGKRIVGKIRPRACHVTATRSAKNNELMVLIHSKDIVQPCVLYSQRWQIETMFKAFKSSGFNLEATRIKDPDRLETLTAIMGIAFAMAYRFGDEREKIKPQKIKKHGARPKSIFRRGIDTIANIRTNKPRLFYKNLKFIYLKVHKFRHLIQEQRKLI